MTLEKPSKPLGDLNLPPAVIACYQRAGITDLFSWQAECLEKASVRDSQKRNFIFSAPGSLSAHDENYSKRLISFVASAGKTIVSELLLIKSVLETKRKALFIEPYVSIVQEKANYFRVIILKPSIKNESIYV